MAKTDACQYFEQVVRLVDGMTTVVPESELISHLGECSTCQSELDQRCNLNKDFQLCSGDKFNRATPKLVETTLAKVRSEFAHPSVAHSGYADVLPWLDPSEDAIGRLGEFELQKFLGRGGMGLVFQAFDHQLRRSVAIKFMAPGILANEDAKVRFIREARAAARINHANVATVHSVNETRGLPFLVMELVQGRSLDAHLKAQEAMPFATILQIARQTALGLEAAHQCGITHRDIKPGNLLVDKNAKCIKIADFGLASTADDFSFTRSGMLIGTPDFISPEQLDSKPVDGRSDLFSLGSLLFLLSTGRLPFASDSFVATIEAVKSRTLPRVNSVNPSIPDDFAGVVEKLTQKSPASRFQSAKELYQALSQISCTGAPGPAGRREPGIFDGTANSSEHRNFFQRNFLLVATAMVAMIGLAAWLCFLTIGWKDNAKLSAGDKTEASAGDSIEKATLDQVDAQPVQHPNSELPGNSAQIIQRLVTGGDQSIQLIPGHEYLLDKPLQINDADVVINGDSKRPPVLIVATGLSECPIEVIGGSLKISGVTMYDSRKKELTGETISCEVGRLEISDSVVKSRNRETCFNLMESELLINSSLLVASKKLITLEPTSYQKVEFRDSVLASECNVELGGPTHFRADFKRCDLVSRQAIRCYENDLEASTLKLIADQTKFMASQAMIGIEFETGEILEDAIDEFPDHLDWIGSKCKLPPNLLVFKLDGRTKSISWARLDVDTAEGSTFARIDSSSIDGLIDRLHQESVSTVELAKETISKFRKSE